MFVGIVLDEWFSEGPGILKGTISSFVYILMTFWLEFEISMRKHFRFHFLMVTPRNGKQHATFGDRPTNYLGEQNWK